MSLVLRQEESVKVVLLGDSGVGKSSLALRFVSNEFKPYSEATIGASFMSKTITVVDDDAGGNTNNEGGGGGDAADESPVSDSQGKRSRDVSLSIWDTAGQEKYHSLAPMYYRGAGAAVLVYDICNRSTFETLQRWVDELEESGPPNMVLAVCGNKHDLRRHRAIAEDVARKYAESVGGFYVETSARDDTNVQALFHEVGRRVPSSVDPDQYDSASAADVEDRFGRVDLGVRSDGSRSWLSPCC